MTHSLFAFNFRLGPWENCLNLNFDQVELAPAFAAVCTRDHLGILWGGNPQQNNEARWTAHYWTRITPIRPSSYALQLSHDLFSGLPLSNSPSQTFTRPAEKSDRTRRSMRIEFLKMLDFSSAQRKMTSQIGRP